MKDDSVFLIARNLGNQFKTAAAAILNLVLGHNLGVGQNFCTKFGTVMDDKQAKATQGS